MTARRPYRARAAVVLAAVALAAAGCSDDDKTALDQGTGTTATSLRGPDAGKALDTVSKGKLTACTDSPNAPFELEENGQFDGIDIELVRAVSGRLGLAPEFVDVDAAGLFAALDAGRCDLVASAVPITDERRQGLDFSVGYFEVNQSLLVRKGDEGRYGDLPALAGRTIGVQSSTAGAALARAKAAGATVQEFAAPPELFAALDARRVDAVVHDHPATAYNATTTGRTVVVKTFTEGDKEQYGFALRKGGAALKAALDDALVQVKSDDTYPTILRRFLGDTTGQI